MAKTISVCLQHQLLILGFTAWFLPDAGKRLHILFGHFVMELCSQRVCLKTCPLKLLVCFIASSP